MKKNYQVFIGIDVSKNKLDFCILEQADVIKKKSGIIANTQTGIRQLFTLLKKKGIELQSVLFCLENTGVYSMPLCYWLQAKGFDYWVVPALEIKKSKGIRRGKSDKADAADIAQYALTHLHCVRLSTLPENDFIELRLLLTQREKTLRATALFNSTLEAVGFVPAAALKDTLKQSKTAIAFLQRQLKAVDKLIDDLVKKNETFKRQNELLQSIPGVGKQTSVTLIAYTQAFTLFKTHRQFACFAGVAPFEYSSGSSIRGKTKVSQLANKKIKSILNMAALSAKKSDPQLNQYFLKKTGEGKNKMLVLNAIRCKIISRAFAVIKRDSFFVNTMKAVA